MTSSTITFDFYGTLVQWHEGVEAAETQWLPFTEVKDVAEAARVILG